MRRVECIMGMPISIDIPDCAGENVFEEVFNRFCAIDERFSPYKKSSELCHYKSGQLKQTDLSTEFHKIIIACVQAEKSTNGYFSAYYSGNFDPTGYVKGYAIAEAAIVIEKYDFKTYCIGAGGDILTRSNDGKIWNIGIQNPKDKQQIVNTLSIKNGAVATSGNYERGDHIINPKTGKPAKNFDSITITGPDIIRADVLATAVFASGNSDLLKKFRNYQAFTV